MKKQILSLILFLLAAVIFAQDNGNRSYCTAIGGGNWEYISNVTVGTINNSSGRTVYSDFTAFSTNLPLAGTTVITVNLGSPYPSDLVGAWIDWNQDEVFNEPMITFTGTPGTQFTGSIVVPPDALAGPTRLRVRMMDGTDLQPCGSTAWGEVEDYTVISPTPLAPAEISIQPQSISTVIFNHIGTSQEILTISNGGEQDLYWNAEVGCGNSSNGTEDYCLDFNGLNQYASINQPFPSFNQYTIEFWRYSEGGSSTAWPRMITMLQDDYHSPDYIVIEHNGPDQNTFEITVDADANHYKAFVDVSAYHNQWLHVALTFDGSITTTYLNGQLAHKSSSGSASFQINNTFIGGCHMPLIGLYRYFNGRLDEIRFWNVARTQQQIQDCMDSTFCTPHEGLLAYWQLDNATGTVITDETGNMAPGNVMNGATWFTPGSPLGNFCPPPPLVPVVVVMPISGIVPPGGFADLTLTFNSGDIPPGVYNNCNLFINSNDPDESQIIVPMSVIVTPPGVLIPLSDWAIVLGVVLMVGVIVWYWRRS